MCHGMLYCNVLYVNNKKLFFCSLKKMMSYLTILVDILEVLVERVYNMWERYYKSFKWHITKGSDGSSN